MAVRSGANFPTTTPNSAPSHLVGAVNYGYSNPLLLTIPPKSGDLPVSGPAPEPTTSKFGAPLPASGRAPELALPFQPIALPPKSGDLPASGPAPEPTTSKFGAPLAVSGRAPEPALPFQPIAQSGDLPASRPAPEPIFSKMGAPLPVLGRAPEVSRPLYAPPHPQHFPPPHSQQYVPPPHPQQYVPPPHPQQYVPPPHSQRYVPPPHPQHAPPPDLLSYQPQPTAVYTAGAAPPQRQPQAPNARKQQKPPIKTTKQFENFGDLENQYFVAICLCIILTLLCNPLALICCIPAFLYSSKAANEVKIDYEKAREHHKKAKSFNSAGFVTLFCMASLFLMFFVPILIVLSNV